jgi:hypothetical protein
MEEQADSRRHRLDRGDVALFRWLSVHSDGKVVVLLNEVLAESASTHQSRQQISWKVLVLGDPVLINNKQCRHIVVSEDRLQMTGHLTEVELDSVTRRQASSDFESAMQDLLSIVERRQLTQEQLNSAVEKAGERAGIEHALEVVATPTVLRELGFLPSHPDCENSLEWIGTHLGNPLKVFSGTDLFGNWAITGACSQPDQLMWDERIVLPSEPRGKLALVVLDLWRNAFGRSAPIPAQLNVAVLYELHRRHQDAFRIGLPTMHVDGEVFRATRRWLIQRHGHLLSIPNTADQPSVALNFDGSLIHFRTESEHFACPAKGAWADDCCVPLQALMDIPSWCLRGKLLHLVRYQCALELRGFELG